MDGNVFSNVVTVGHQIHKGEFNVSTTSRFSEHFEFTQGKLKMKRSSRRWKKKGQMRWKWQRKRMKKEKRKRARK
jgi:large subunit ribosomal protein L41e